MNYAGFYFGRAILANWGGGGCFKLHLETRILPFAIDDPCDHEVAGSAVLSTDDQQGLLGRRDDMVRSNTKIVLDSGLDAATDVLLVRYCGWSSVVAVPLANCC